ncbi:MAG: acyl-CoA/acyl-ACP dehydrogenase [Planctomycetaceae bacterium]|nr:acyl-CoA/acyl-ACP dehydrogenase [Planctomycetaceae bacterium]
MQFPTKRIDRYDPGQLQQLRTQLRDLRSEQSDNCWPAAQLQRCAESGVFNWFLPQSAGGTEWTTANLLRGYFELAAGCLTTAFVLTQCMGACQRIAASENKALKDELLSDLTTGQRLATLGISQLTTSQRHLGKPALIATPVGDKYRLDGRSPWVTGACHTDLYVLAAATEDGQQMLCAVNRKESGIQVKPAPELVGLTGSATSEVILNGVLVSSARQIAGPAPDLMSRGGGNAGGLQTSALAIGLASESIDFITEAAEKRPDLSEFSTPLRCELDALKIELLSGAAPQAPPLSKATAFDPFQCRAKANSLALRATQAALIAAKGSGYVRGHSAGRWCQEALFFLVWSCPRPVVENYRMELIHAPTD